MLLILTLITILVEMGARAQASLPLNYPRVDVETPFRSVSIILQHSLDLPMRRMEKKKSTTGCSSAQLSLHVTVTLFIAPVHAPVTHNDGNGFLHRARIEQTSQRA